MLIRLIYASQTTQPMRPSDVEELLSRAQVANHNRDLTGALVFNHRSFLQALEGEREVVSDLYGRLVHDPRHQRLVILAYEDIVERSFADWGMGFAAADASHRQLFLRHGVSSQFDPHALTGAAALQLLVEMTRQKARPKTRAAAAVAA